MDFVAIDFETANSDRKSACSMGMVRVRNGEIVERFYELINPAPLVFSPVNISVHGIMPEMVAFKPTFMELWARIKCFIGQDILVAHNASFEQSVINQILEQNGVEIPDFDYLCTLYMTNVNYPNRSEYRLDKVCKDLLSKSINHHNSLEDAVACAELAVHNISQFPKQPLRDLMGALYLNPLKDKIEWKKLTGLKPSREELDCNHPYFDKKFVVIGIFKTFSKEKAVQLLIDCGAVYQKEVTDSTDYILIGDEEYHILKSGAKVKNAKKIDNLNKKGKNISFVREHEFLSTEF